MDWKIKKTKEVYRNKWMWITEDNVETDSGHKMLWGIVHKEPAVLVIPWDGESLYLVGQYRYPVDFYSWEFVAGHFEHKSIEDAAVHELKEEAGISAGKMELIGKFFIAPGHNTQECYVYLATNLSFGDQSIEPDEVAIKVKKVKPSEIIKLIKEGAIKDGPTIAAFSIFNIKIPQY